MDRKPRSRNGVFSTILKSGWAQIPKKHIAFRGGEDGCYTDKNIMIVTDGVGSWNDKGINPGLYAKDLCIEIMKACYDAPSQPLKLSLKEAVGKSNNRFQGSATLIFALRDI